MPEKASVGVAIIARNAAKTIGACLDSIVPYVKEVVVSVDAGSTDDTARVAKQHGARVYTGLQVSEYHECPAHGRVLAQHFAKARNASFAKLSKRLEWHMWLDADDILKGGEKLHDFLTKLDPAIDGVWLNYHYAKAGQDGPTSTLFDRERLVRTEREWSWQHRVHEVLAPVGATAESMNWARTDDITVHHQNEGHDTAGSARRNILLLEIDLEENPEDMRAWFYMGNQFFAIQEWHAAAECYQRACAADNPYQLWQTYIYLSMACEKLGDIEGAKWAAFRALDIQPGHPEPWYRLGICKLLENNLEQTEFWTHFGNKLPDPPFFVFRNPLDRTFNSHLTLAQAYANAGRTSKARQQLEMAAKVVPTKEVLEGIEFNKKLEEDSLLADAYVRVLTETGINLLGTTNERAWKFGRVRDILVPELIKSRGESQPRIIFFCGRSVEPWAPPVLNTTGIGGSETAVIQIAKRFAQDGWRVDVYNDCDRYEGIYDEVGYWDCKRLADMESCDVLVSWRNPAAYDLPVARKVSLLWNHDLNRGPDAAKQLARWDRALGVSQWHADYLSQVYGISNTGYVPNGIELGRFQGDVKKVPFRCVYASSPDRGLPNLLRMWPKILQAEPSAELHVAYGWETFDKSLALWPNPKMAQIKQEVLELLEKTPRVVWRGRLPQDELAKLYQESYCWLYPTSFTEVSCITAMEAMAGGCVPVTSAAGALPETIGDAGIIVEGNTYSHAWKEFWLQCAKAALMSPDVRVPLMQKGILRAKGLTWDDSYHAWRHIINECLGIEEKQADRERELVIV